MQRLDKISTLSIFYINSAFFPKDSTMFVLKVSRSEWATQLGMMQVVEV